MKVILRGELQMFLIFIGNKTPKTQRFSKNDFYCVELNDVLLNDLVFQRNTNPGLRSVQGKPVKDMSKEK